MPDLPAALLLVLVPLLPLVGSLATVVFGRLLGPRAHWPAVVSIAAAAVAALTLLVGLGRGLEGGHAGTPPTAVEFVTTLWQWATVDGAVPFSIPIALRLDPLTATMLALVTCVGLLVAVYSIGYMHGDPGYPRFFG